MGIAMTNSEDGGGTRRSRRGLNEATYNGGGTGVGVGGLAEAAGMGVAMTNPEDGGGTRRSRRGLNEPAYNGSGI